MRENAELYTYTCVTNKITVRYTRALETSMISLHSH